MLEGSRNPFDGCWDIPIAKVKLHENHFKEPISHAGLYSSKHTLNSKPVTLQSNHTKKLPKTFYDKQVFRHLNSLLDHTILDEMIA